MQEFLKELNDAQQKAVTYGSGPILVLAGAGSGKTRVITYRIIYLIEKMGVKPENILAITFTNKAANEMKERVQRLLKEKAEGLNVSTFHSACVKILKENVPLLGYKKYFVIYDTDDQQSIIKQCLKELNLDEKKYPLMACLEKISGYKEKLISETEAFDSARDIREKTFSNIYLLYQKKLRENNAFDFDDLIMKTVELFRKYPEVLDYYSEKFKYILVDEYQDTNHAQYIFIKLLAEKHRNLLVVGDDDQSIYSFRGADIRNILEFEKDFPDAFVVKLEKNYRSTQTILDAANEVIKNNFSRKEKRLFTEKGKGDKVFFAELQNEHHEALFIGNEIEKLINNGYYYKNIAVLYRTNAQSRVFEEVFLKMGIPHRVFGGIRFFQRKEIKDIVAYLRLIENDEDNMSLRRIINVPRRGIGSKTVEQLEIMSDQTGKSIFRLIMEDNLPFSHSLCRKLKEFALMIEDLRELKERIGIPELMERIILNTGYLEELQNEGTEEANDRIENIKELISVAREFVLRNSEGTLEEFLSEIALYSDLDKYSDEEDAVTLMTLHSAKGLEFSVVFLAGLEEGIFPHYKSLFNNAELEEERRLCYVGITRAKELLYLTRAWQRNLYGRSSYYDKSRFIKEIPKRLIKDVTPGKENLFGEEVDLVPEEKDNKIGIYKGTSNSTEIEKLSFNFNPGDKIKHAKWGEGIVTEVHGTGEDVEITVFFEKEGKKHLLAKYAPLIKMN
ncbi:DNA helicase PcrA [Thermovenabulum gondwanense]|uniref:ATP-dependent DNA helicase n=1 Tax=Thermovenabulum gondwanense TaxID=520767 RepID=A0A162N3H5_9FIRM|nr:DNA helicase PcrA [Thermovenabulum gondwanense]KYO68744.1 ATP-dependent DNA helicase PcrA [Thermovenabulum gondwanense]